jgi:hypothetical protein
MTRGIALRYLLGLWLIAVAILSTIILIQSVLGKYGDESKEAWAWLASIAVPPLSLVLTAALTESSIGWHDGPADKFKFRLAFIFGTICILAALTTILIEPFVKLSYFELFEHTSLELALWQGLSVAAIGGVVFEGR